MATDRRGFLKRLFGREPPFEVAFLGLQLVVPAWARDDLRQRLHEVIAAPHPHDETPADRQQFWRRVVALLRSCEPFWAWGWFEYTEEAQAAREKFHTWVTEIEATLSLVDEEMDDEVDGMARLDNERQYVVVSLLFLLREPNAVARGLLEAGDETWTRRNLGHLLETLLHFRWETLEADAIYLAPGNDQDGFSELDLADEGWAYLRPLS